MWICWKHCSKILSLASAQEWGLLSPAPCSIMSLIISKWRSPHCSLDAEKCFDSISHNSLFYKLHNKIPDALWLTLRKWCKELRATVRWKQTQLAQVRPLMSPAVQDKEAFSLPISSTYLSMDSWQSLRTTQSKYESAPVKSTALRMRRHHSYDHQCTWPTDPNQWVYCIRWSMALQIWSKQNQVPN